MISKIWLIGGLRTIESIIDFGIEFNWLIVNGIITAKGFQIAEKLINHKLLTLQNNYGALPNGWKRWVWISALWQCRKACICLSEDSMTHFYWPIVKINVPYHLCGPKIPTCEGNPEDWNPEDCCRLSRSIVLKPVVAKDVRVSSDRWPKCLNDKWCWVWWQSFWIVDFRVKSSRLIPRRNTFEIAFLQFHYFYTY